MTFATLASAATKLWQATVQVLPLLRVSYVVDATTLHVLLESPTESYVGMGELRRVGSSTRDVDLAGIGPRIDGGKMLGADILMMLLRADGTLCAPARSHFCRQLTFGVVRRSGARLHCAVRSVAASARHGVERHQRLVRVAFRRRCCASLIRERENRFDTRAERTDGLTRFYASRMRVTGDVNDNPINETMIETLFSVGSVSASEGDENEIVVTYHGSDHRRLMSLSYVTPVDVAANATAAPSLAPIILEETDNQSLVIGVIVGVGLALILLGVIVALAICLVRRARKADNTERGVDLQHLELKESERHVVPAHLKELELTDAKFPIALVNPTAGIFRDPVPQRFVVSFWGLKPIGKLFCGNCSELDIELLARRRAAQEEQQVAVQVRRLIVSKQVFTTAWWRQGLRMLVVEQIYCDIIQLRNTSQAAHSIRLYLPEIRPQMQINIEPSELKLAAGATGVVVLRIRLLCTTKQRLAIKVGCESSYADLPLIKLEGELRSAIMWLERARAVADSVVSAPVRFSTLTKSS